MSSFWKSPFGDGFEIFIEAGGVVFDEVRIELVGAPKLSCDAEEEGDVGAGTNRKMEIGDGAGGGAAGIDHDDFGVGVGFFAGFDAPEEDGVAPGGVGAGDEESVAVVDVFVGDRRGVGTERGLVAGDGGGHAEAGVGVDVVGAEKAFDDFIGEIIFLSEALAGDVEGDGIGAVIGDDAFELCSDMIDGLGPGDGFKGGVAGGAQMGESEAGVA